MIALITPLHRPRDLESALATHARCAASASTATRSYVVSNGAARGMTALTSEPHQSHALNVGLAAAEADGCSHWLKLDADDYYGSGYVDEQVAGLVTSGATLVGKSDGWLSLSNGRLLLRRCRGENVETFTLHGHTLGGRCADGLRFEAVWERWGEDADLLGRVCAAGGRAFSTSIHGCCYMRRDDGNGHTFGLTDHDMLTLSSGQFWEGIGGFSQPIVDGRASPTLTPFTKPERKPWYMPQVWPLGTAQATHPDWGRVAGAR